LLGLRYLPHSRISRRLPAWTPLISTPTAARSAVSAALSSTLCSRSLADSFACVNGDIAKWKHQYGSAHRGRQQRRRRWCRRTATFRRNHINAGEHLIDFTQRPPTGGQEANTMATPDQPRYANPRILLSGDGPISSSHRCTNRRRFGCRLGVGVSDSRGRAANSHRGTRRRLRRDGTASNNLYCPPCPKLQRPLHRDRRRNGYYG
jgi:hypothetical protein